MTRHKQVTGLVLALLACATELGGCSAEEVPLEEEPSDDGGDSTGMAGASGAVDTPPKEGNACTFRGSPPGDSAYGFCTPPLGTPTGDYTWSCPERSDGGRGAHGWSLGELDDACGGCVCDVECDADDDCPAPDGGTVSPVCNDGSCEFPCDDGDTCPDGMRCVPHHDKGNFCAWVTDADNSFSCWAELETGRQSLNDEICSQFTTRESCEARLDADPYQPQVACVWAVESIYSTIDDSCEVLSEEEHCVLARAHGQDGESEITNRCGDRSVFWADLGPQTASLTVIEQCGYEPYFGGRACELGDPSIPLLCNCGCE